MVSVNFDSSLRSNEGVPLAKQEDTMGVEEETSAAFGVKDCSDDGAAAAHKTAEQAQAAEQPAAPAEEAPVGEQDGAAAKAPADAAADAAAAAAIAVEKEAEKRPRSQC